MKTEIGRLLTAMVTPFKADGSVDYDGAARLARMLVEDGSDGVVVSGTTGESPSLNDAEKVELVRVVKAAIPGKNVVAGTGSNDTHHSVELSKLAMKAGADALLAVVPYYNKPPQEGLYRHFKAIAEAVDLPLILYNVPGRTSADLSNETVLRLAQVPGIVGIKDATGNIERGSQLLRDAPPDFAVYSGDDLTAVALMLLGGHGNISVTANVAPRAMSELCAAAMRGDASAAWAIQRRLLPLHKQLFVEANPIPVKWALHRMGRIGSGIRLPLVPLAPSHHETLAAAMRDAGIA